MRCIQFSFLAVLLVFIFPVLAGEDDFGDSTDTDFIAKAWKETNVNIPARITDSDLIEFKVFEMPRYQYFIDAKTLTLSKSDNIVRYAVVIQTSSGIRNIFYEGIRCDTGQYKLYATAIAGERLRPLARPEWKAINAAGVTIYRTDLYRDFLCQDSLIRAAKSDILDLMRYTTDSNDDSDMD